MIESALRISPEGPKASRWVNESFVLTCSEDQLDMTGKSLEWLRNGVPIKSLMNTNKQRVMLDPSGGRELRLLLFMSLKEDAGEYKCILKEEPSGRVLDSKELTMYIFETIQYRGEMTKTVREGSRFNLPCSFTYDTQFTPSVSWLRNSSVIERSNKYDPSQLQGYPWEAYLGINNVQKEDSGLYICQVLLNSPMKTDVKLFTLNLNVTHKPRFSAESYPTGYIDEQKFAKPGPKSVRLHCMVEANPPATLIWRLYPSDRPLENTSDQYSWERTDGVNQANLTITYRNPDKRTRGKEKKVSPDEFSCEAVNSLGTASRKFNVKVSKLPKTPEILQHEIKDNVLTISIREQKINPSVDKYGVQIANRLIEFPANPEGNGTYTVKIENVPGGYHAFRLLAHNPVGYSEALATEAMKLSISSSTSIFINLHLLFILIISAIFINDY